jgi:hypothetical protein
MGFSLVDMFTQVSRNLHLLFADKLYCACYPATIEMGGDSTFILLVPAVAASGAERDKYCSEFKTSCCAINIGCDIWSVSLQLRLCLAKPNTPADRYPESNDSRTDGCLPVRDIKEKGSRNGN